MNAPIIIATDFSAAGNDALQYAVRMAQALGSPLHLLSFNVAVPPMTDASIPGDIMALMAYRELLEGQQQKMQEALAQGEQQLSRDFPGISVTVRSIDAMNISDGLNNYAANLDPLLVIIGTHARHGAAETWDSDGLALLRHSKHPVLMVPTGCNRSNWQRAALAWDGGPLAPDQQATLAKLAAALGLQIDAVYVQPDEGDAPNDSALAGVPARVHIISAKDVSEGLKSFTAAGGHELLIVLPHHHSLWERLFFKLHTPGLISEMNIPVLVIPE
jgi:nucleotide-binding universal stress UspA family protein